MIMKIGQRIKTIRKNLSLTQNELSLKSSISRSYLADVENDRYNPSINTLEKIATALNVSTDRLTGEAASSTIEDRIVELSMTLQELSEKTKIPLHFLINLDNIIPDEMGYENMTRIANAIGIQPGILRAAFARQEPPLYDDLNKSSAADDFVAPYADFEIHSVGKLIKIPIIGTVTAGPNGLAYEDYQGEERIDTSLVNGGNFFYLRIKGDSMIGDGILPGDLALVRETPEVEYGALAIAIVNGEEGTIKRVYQNGDSVTLLASNPQYPPRIFKKEEMSNVRIVGEVKMTMRNY